MCFSFLSVYRCRAWPGMDLVRAQSPTISLNEGGRRGEGPHQGGFSLNLYPSKKSERFVCLPHNFHLSVRKSLFFLINVADWGIFRTKLRNLTRFGYISRQIINVAHLVKEGRNRTFILNYSLGRLSP